MLGFLVGIGESKAPLSYTDKSYFLSSSILTFSLMNDLQICFKLKNSPDHPEREKKVFLNNLSAEKCHYWSFDLTSSSNSVF